MPFGESTHIFLSIDLRIIILSGRTIEMEKRMKSTSKFHSVESVRYVPPPGVCFPIVRLFRFVSD